MSLVNVAYNLSYTWASREIQTLEQQISIPLFNEQPVELGLRGREEMLLAQLSSDATYARQFYEAFPSSEPVSIENIIYALASFVRTIISADSPFDRLLYLDDQDAMSETALRGMQLFFSEELKCGVCHEGQNLAGGQHIGSEARQTPEFHNTGLYDLDGSYPNEDSGLRLESGDNEDDGKFRAPSLRNIAITAPYMHDGSIRTLSEVIDHYAAGGRARQAGTSHLLTGFELGAEEKRDLLSFLENLTDDAVLADHRFSAPTRD